MTFFILCLLIFSKQILPSKLAVSHLGAVTGPTIVLSVLSLWGFQMITCLSYVTFQGNFEIGSHKTNGR